MIDLRKLLADDDIISNLSFCKFFVDNYLNLTIVKVLLYLSSFTSINLCLMFIWPKQIGLFSKIDIHEVPGLYRLLQEGEDPEILKRLSPEELLIRWVNYQMEQAGKILSLTERDY